MVTPLLQTKFYIPPPRPEWVPRPRLIERLNEGLRLGRPITLISAPAGCGKTTLLSEWIHRRGGALPPPTAEVGRANAAPLQVAWLSLDEGDDDLARFLTYLIGALQHIPSLKEAGFGEAALAMLRASLPCSARIVGRVP